MTEGGLSALLNDLQRGASDDVRSKAANTVGALLEAPVVARNFAQCLYSSSPNRHFDDDDDGEIPPGGVEVAIFASLKELIVCDELYLQADGAFALSWLVPVISIYQLQHIIDLLPSLIRSFNVHAFPLAAADDESESHLNFRFDPCCIPK